MHRHNTQRRPLLLAVLTMFIATLFAAPSTLVAQADPSPWPIELPEVSDGTSGTGVRLYTHGDNSVTFADCFTYTSSSGHLLKARTFNTGGLVTNRVFSEHPTYQVACEPLGAGATGASANDGTFYATLRYNIGGGYSKLELSAFKNNKKLWATSYQMCPSGSGKWATFHKVTVGADGDIYALLNGSNSCQTVPDSLVGLDASDGSVKFIEALNNDITSLGTNQYHLSPHGQGLVVLDGNELRYFNYDGTEITANNYTLSPPSGYCYNFYTTEAMGRMYFQVRQEHPTYSACVYNSVEEIFWRDVDGTTGQLDLTPYTIVPSRLIPMPDGDLVVGDSYSNGSKLRRFSTSGQLLSTIDLKVSPDSNYTLLSASILDVDANGNIYATKRIKKKSGDQDTHSLIHRIDPQGNESTVFSTTEYDIQGTWQSLTLYSVGFADGLLYTFMKGTGHKKLIQINAPFAAMDYPRSEILGAIPEERSYASLGDSYSSAEGNAPFLYGTDEDGTGSLPENRCHRSPQAYSMLLDQDPAMDLNLKSFVACSGATTIDAITGQWNEPGQLSHVDEETDVVTITIGGNDINFKEFASLCVVDDCSGVAYGAIMARLTDPQNPDYLPDALDDLWTVLQSRLGESTKVFVVGYPWVVVPNISLSCPYLSLAEREAAQNVVTELNDVLYDSLTRVLLPDDSRDERFHFVEPNITGGPFEGRQLCNSDSYFIGPINGDVDTYTFHPNEAGQEAYATLIGNAIQAYS